MTYVAIPNSIDGVLRCLGRIVTVFALCCAIGLHWIAVQSIAWTAMMIQNSRHASFCHAMERTFDGAHPCSLCQIVSKGESSGQKKDLMSSSTLKIDIICVTRPIGFLPRFVFLEYQSISFGDSEIGNSPPSPPPRSSLS